MFIVVVAGSSATIATLILCTEAHFFFVICYGSFNSCSKCYRFGCPNERTIFFVLSFYDAENVMMLLLLLLLHTMFIYLFICLLRSFAVISIRFMIRHLPINTLKWFSIWYLFQLNIAYNPYRIFFIIFIYFCYLLITINLAYL